MANIVRYRPLDIRRNTGQHPGLWDPISRLHQEMNQLFENRFFRPWNEEESERETQFVPSLDVNQDESRYEISIELPGVSQEDVSVDVQGDQLIIEGSKTEICSGKEREKLHSKRRYGAFRQELTLPEDAEDNTISANFANGVLTVVIPRDENRTEGRRRHIEVKGDGSADMSAAAAPGRTKSTMESKEAKDEPVSGNA